MPIYEYFCDKCHKEFEELVFGDELPNCPHCGVARCQKLMSRPCLHRGGASGDGSMATSASSSSSKCGGCSGGNCATCH